MDNAKNNQKKLKQLFALLDEMEAYARCIGKVSFDMECCAPEEGIAQAGEDMATIGRQFHKLMHSKKYVKLICELHEDSEGLTEVQKKAVEHKYDEYIKSKNESAKFAYEMNLASSKAYGEWLAAKKAADFSLYRDSMATLIDFTRRSIDLRDEKKPTYYDALLDDYEKGNDHVQLDAFFGALKERIVPLMKRIVAEGKPIREDFLTRSCPIPEQEAFSKYLLRIEGLRESALVLMTTEHPFTTNFGANDVRVTTHYFEDNFISNIFSTLHEGGHALFMQNEPQEFYANHAANHARLARTLCIKTDKVPLQHPAKAEAHHRPRRLVAVRHHVPRVNQQRSVRQHIHRIRLHAGVNQHRGRQDDADSRQQPVAVLAAVRPVQQVF
mgnify:CR=1 FL=1